MNTLTQYILIKNFVFIMIDMSPWQEVLTTRWQDKYPRGGLRDGDRGFHGFQGRTTNGQPNGLSTLFPRQSMQQGIRSSLQWQNGLCRLNTNNFRSPFHKCQKAEKIDRCQNQWDGPQAKPVFLQLILSQCLGPHSKFGATMRNSFVHEPGRAGQWPQLGHATAVRQFVRSRQGSRSDRASRASRASRGSRARASHAFEPI